MRMPLRMLIMGSPGSGKNTISVRITKAYPRITYFSSGDLFRRHILRKTDIGNNIQRILNSGQLVDDDLAISMVLSDLAAFEKDKSWLLDGFPRTIIQAQKLDEHLQDVALPLHCVINLDVPEQIIIDRVTDRWVHVASGRTYNLKFNPPKVHGLDDVTGDMLVKRKDDDQNIFKERLVHYHKETEPLLEYYSRQSILYNIKGSTSNELFPKVARILNEI